jgi:hypothetical protein
MYVGAIHRKCQQATTCLSLSFPIEILAVGLHHACYAVLDMMPR